ncbi:MAG: flagellar export chaperone FliS [Planctomycetota bacterium]
MASAAQAYSAYKTAEVTTLTQRDLLIKLFEGIDRFLVQAAAGMRNSNPELTHKGCSKAKRIIVELLSTLNFDVGGEMATQMRDLYLFMLTEISGARLNKEPERLDRLREVVAPLLEGWRSVPDTFANLSSLPISERSSTLNVRT